MLSCDLCRSGNIILLVPLDPTCEGCVNIQKVAQAYMLPESPWTTCLEIKYHDSPEYAITLCDDQKGIPQWGGYDIVLTLTTIADQENPWGLATTNCDKFNKNASLDLSDPIADLGESTESLRTMELTRTWLQECKQHHEASCWRDYQKASPRSYPPLPHRVLDVGTVSSGRIRLCEDTEIDAPYMCLSYCWGNERQRVLTTRDNKEKHKAGMKTEDLPLLFRQFIRVARFLGVAYIWIDALCIVQDDEEDWKNESSKMAQIYSNSWLTIAATAASGPHDSLFKDRTTNTFQSTEKPFCVRVTRHFPNKPGEDDPKAIFPLLRRGWVYQERLLSPRMLHFGPDEITWECFKKRRCECGQSKHWQNEINKTELFNSSAGLGSRHDLMVVGNLWRIIVVQYTKLALTKPKDRLYALDGIRKTVGVSRQEAFNDVYLAGLWKETLAFDLLWYVEDCHRSSGRTQEQRERAPSWSWASVDGPVEYTKSLYCFPDLKMEQLCHVVVDDDNSATSASSPQPIGSIPIRLECQSSKFTMSEDHRYVHLDHQNASDGEELYLCKIFQEYPGKYHALVLQAHGQVFSRVGYAWVEHSDMFWSKETFTFIVI